VKSAVDVTSYRLYVETNYSYSFWRHYSSEHQYTIQTTIRHRSEYEANIRDMPTLQSHVRHYWALLDILYWLKLKSQQDAAQNNKSFQLFDSNPLQYFKQVNNLSRCLSD